MILRGLQCAGCGAADLVAVQPGCESEYSDAPLFCALDRGEAARAWCAVCWPAAPRREVVA